MADPFQPKFVDLVRNYTTTVGTADFKLGSVVNGYTGFAAACAVGDQFYYSAIGVDKPAEREVGRGTLLANGIVKRDPISGTKTNFTTGTKSIALIAAAEWFTGIDAAASASEVAAASASSRTALAGLSQRQNPAVLYETGREGTFVWSSANLSAQVTSDPSQAVYVAPTTDPTGASGAWVRRYSGAINVRWFGAVGNSTTDDYPALQAALNFVSSTGGSIFVPAGIYRSSQRLVNTAPVHIFGEAQGQGNLGGGLAEIYLGTTLYFDAGVAGFLNHYINDDNRAGPATYKGGSNTIIEHIRFQSAAPDKTVSAGKYGIESRSKITLRNIELRAFGDHGVYIRASLSGGDGVVYGNANNSLLINVRSLENGGDGFKISGNDANNITFLNCHGQDNAGWDFTDDAFINSTYLTCLSEGGDLGAFRTIRSGAVHTYIGCNTEGGTCSIGLSCTAVGGTLGQHTGLSAFCMTGGIADSKYIQARNRNDATIVGGSLGSSTGRVALAFGSDNNQNYQDWKLMLNPGGGTATGTWALVYGGSSSTLSIAFPDGNTRTGRSHACEFPRGVVIGEQGVAGSLAKLITTGTAAPASGTWQQGDLVINRAPAAGGTWAWLCTTAGTPGTWQALNAATGVNTGDQTITLTGDVGGSGTGSFAATIAANAVTYAKFQQVAASSLVGNPTGSLANAQGITLGADHAFSGATLQLGGFTGDISKAAGSLATTVANNAVTYAKMQDVSATQRVVGRNTAGAGDPEEVTASQLLDWVGATQGQILYRGATGWSVLATGTSGQFLKTQGAAANPVWADAVVGVTTANGVSATLSSGSLTFALGAITPTSVASMGAVTSSSATAGVGYATGAGGTVTQLTNKSTAVTLNKVSGQVTTNSASMAAGAVVSFVVNNSQMVATDTVNLNLASGNATAGTYRYWVEGIAAGSFKIVIENRSAGALAEALTFSFAVVKAVNA